MKYVLIYWVVGVVVNLLLTLLIERTEKFNWKSFLLYWIVLPFIFPLTLIASKDEIADAFKHKTRRSKNKYMKSETTTPLKKQEPTGAKEDEAFEQEWQEFVKDSIPSENIHVIERKVVADDYIVAPNSEKMVIYLEDSRNEMVNAFIEKHYNVICRIFKQWGYTFIYAPKEVEKIAQHYALPMPEVEWNAATMLNMLQCSLNEPIGTAMVVIDDIDWDDDWDCWVAMMRGVQLDAEDEAELTAQIRGYWKQLNEEYNARIAEERALRYRIVEDGDDDNIRYRMSEDGCASETRSEESAKLTKYYGADKESVAVEPIEERCCTAGYLFSDDGEGGERRREETLRRRDEAPDYKRCERKKEQETFLSSITKRIKSVGDSLEALADDFLNEEEQLSDTDQQLLKEIQERVEKLRQRGIKQHLIDQFVKMTVQKSHLQVTPDARILLTDYRKEVQMLPIDKVVYIFFLRHPEGVTLKALSDHKEELLGLYARVLGKTKLTDKQKASVERLCDPWDNSINEKLSRIRKSFCAEVHESVANHYVIQGSRGEDRTITLEEELIVADEWLR